MYKPFKLEEIPKDESYTRLYSINFIAIIHSQWYIGYIIYDDEDGVFMGRNKGNGHQESYLLSKITHYMLIPDCSHLK